MHTYLLDQLKDIHTAAELFPETGRQFSPMITNYETLFISCCFEKSRRKKMRYGK